MNTAVPSRLFCDTVIDVFLSANMAEFSTDAIHAFLQQHVEAEKIKGCIVIGIVDENGSSVMSCGKMDNQTRSPMLAERQNQIPINN